jgi:hypothetical protein
MSLPSSHINKVLDTLINHLYWLMVECPLHSTFKIKEPFKNLTHCTPALKTHTLESCSAHFISKLLHELVHLTKIFLNFSQN